MGEAGGAETGEVGRLGSPTTTTKCDGEEGPTRLVSQPGRTTGTRTPTVYMSLWTGEGRVQPLDGSVVHPCHRGT